MFYLLLGKGIGRIMGKIQKLLSGYPEIHLIKKDEIEGLSQLMTDRFLEDPCTLLQLDGMEKSGLISRCKNEQDKRNVDVELTEQGEKAAIEAMQNRQAYADELFDTIPQRKKQQLAGLLDSLLHTWDIPINEEEYQYRNTEE